MTKQHTNHTRRDFIKIAATGGAAAMMPNALAGSAGDTQPATERKLRVALAGLFEEVNTFAVETMGLATITGSMSTGFQKYEGQEIIDEFKGTSTQLGGTSTRSTRCRPRSCPRFTTASAPGRPSKAKPTSR